jgi:hypothetical protein
METKTEGHLPFLDMDPTILWATECTVNLPVPTSTLMLGPTNTHPTSKPYFPHWCRGLQLYAIKTACMLSQHNKSVGLPPKKVSSFLQPVKDNLELRTPGVYRILLVRQGLHFADRPFRRHNVEGASAAHLSRTSRQVSHG